MKTFKQFLENTKNNIFPKMGDLPIPEGTIRLYHQTDEENVQSIKEKGLLKSFSKGRLYNEPSFIWATEKPFYGRQEGLATIEFFVPEEEFRSPTHILSEVVPPAQILAIHEHWHDYAEELVSSYPEINQKEIDYWLDLGGNYKKAAEFYIDYMKSKGKL